MNHSSCQRFLIPSTAPASNKRSINGLKSGDKGQEAGAEAQPQLNDNDDSQNILLVRKPLDRLQNNPDFHQETVK